jgi:SSS family solute:Na+ symporter
MSDVLNALTLAYNLLVGGTLIPLIGAIYWRRATSAGATASMILGCVTVLVFILKDGIAANSPIYYSLAVGLCSYIGVSLYSQSGLDLKHNPATQSSLSKSQDLL